MQTCFKRKLRPLSSLCHVVSGVSLPALGQWLLPALPNIAAKSCTREDAAPLLLCVPEHFSLPRRALVCLLQPVALKMHSTASSRSSHVPAFRLGLSQVMYWSMGPQQSAWVTKSFSMHKIMKDVGLLGVFSCIFVLSLDRWGETHLQ